MDKGFFRLFTIGLLLVGVAIGFWQRVKWANESSFSPPLRLPAQRSFSTEEENPDDSSIQLFKKSFIQNLRLWDEAEYSKIFLPSLQWVTENGESIGLCEEFPRLIFVFAGEGVVTHGQKPSMEWEWDCQMDEALNPLSLEVNRETLTSQLPFEGEWELPPRHGLMRFFNTIDAWPSAWALEHIFFENQQGISRLEISKDEIIQFRQRPLGIRWKM